jgi:predicted lipid-binding transport protein (Tim44 family)
VFASLKTGKGLSNVGIGIVFAIAAYISADHIYHVAMGNGQTLNTALALPGILDIFGLFCAIRRRATQARVQRILTASGMWGVLTISLLFNVEYALMINVTMTGFALAKAVFISAIPAAIIALAAEILTHVRKSSSSATKPKDTPKPASKAPSKPAAASTTPKVTTPRQRKPIKSETPSDAIAA